MAEGYVVASAPVTGKAVLTWAIMLIAASVILYIAQTFSSGLERSEGAMIFRRISYWFGICLLITSRLIHLQGVMENPLNRQAIKSLGQYLAMNTLIIATIICLWSLKSTVFPPGSIANQAITLGTILGVLIVLQKSATKIEERASALSLTPKT